VAIGSRLIVKGTSRAASRTGVNPSSGQPNVRI
jgi:hypothetical protein